MPEAITERVHAPAVVGRHHLAGLVEVRDVSECLVAQSALADDGGAGSRMDLAVEALRELELLGIGERLIAEDEQGELVHPLVDLIERCAIMHAPQIDLTD